MTSATIELAQSSTLLMSPWKPIVIWATFVAWAWLIGTKIDPDARTLQLDPTKWNIINLLAGIVGLGAMLFAGVFYMSWPIGAAILIIPNLVYLKVRNKSVDEDRKYRLFAGKKTGGGQKKKRRKARGTTITLVFEGPAGECPVPDKDDEDLLDVYLNVQSILQPAVSQGSSRVDLALGSSGLAFAFVTNTVRVKQEPIEGAAGAKAVAYIKQVAGLDVSDARRSQSGGFTIIGEASRHTVTVTATGSSKGQFLRLDIDEAARIVVPLDAIGFLPQQRDVLNALREPQNRHGIVLLASPQGQGLTTTGLSILNQHDAYTCNIKALERRTVKGLEGVDHVQWDPSNPDLDYATSLQSILRRDPDIVLAEVLDPDTAQVASKAGRDGALQYLSLNGDSAAAVIREWCRLVGDVDQATKPLRAVICQRLVRVLCPDCRQPYTPAQPSKMGLKEGTTLYKAGGQVQVRNRVEDCSTCGGSGYTGVTGIFEVFPVDEECRQILASGDLKAALMQARRNKMLLLQEVGLKRAASGITSIEEVSRVLGGGQASKAGTKPAASAKN